MHSTLRSILIALSVLCTTAVAGTALDPGFTDTLYATLPDGTPTGIAWAPDGSNRLFVAMQEGSVRIVENGAVRATPFATISAYTESECGVLGLCFDPGYVQNHYVYVFVTVSASEQRILRFTDVNSIGMARVNIITKLPTLGQNHDGGAVGFGHDGKLYWAIGDLGDKRGVDGDLKTLAAKVGRANADGSVPRDNPFNDGVGPNNDYIWATGFRNPFTLTFQPRTGKLFLNVVGSTPDGQTSPNSGPGYEQVFALNAGDDGGYDDYEGNQPTGARYTTPFVRPYAHPLIQYKSDTSADAADRHSVETRSWAGFVLSITTTSPHSYRVGQAIVLSGDPAANGTYLIRSVPSPISFTCATDTAFATFPEAPDPTIFHGGSVAPLVQGSSITGGTFLESSSVPEEYRGNFFYADFTGDQIFRARFDNDGAVVRFETFLRDAAQPVDIATGPDGVLYYASIGEDSIHRVSWTGPTPGLGIVLTPTVLPIQEGGSGVCSVRLIRAPAADVTIHIERSDGDPALSTRGNADLTFTPTNWSVPQPVTIASTPDFVHGRQSGKFTASATGYQSQVIAVTAADDAAESPTLSTTSLTIVESTNGTFTVQLPARPLRPVTLTIRRTAGPRTTYTRNSAFVFTPANWNVPRTVLVVARRDANTTNDDATFTVAARGYNPRQVVVTVREPGQ